MPAREEPVTVAAIEADIAQREERSRLSRVRRGSPAAATCLAAGAGLTFAALSPGGDQDHAAAPPPITRTSGPEAEVPAPGRADRGTITIPHYDPIP